MAKKRKPKLLVFDFDGVLTNNKVILNQDGIESVVCDRSDGMGFEMLRHAGIPTLILSKEKNPVVTARAKKLKVPVMQAVDDKPTALRAYCAKHKFNLKDVLYVGNDLNDVGVMKIVGTSACPSDSHPMVKKISTIKLKKKGGDGAVRELVELHLGIGYPGV